MDDLINDLKNLGNNAFKDIMLEAKTEAKNHFKKSFDDEGFTDEKLTKWQPVKRKKSKKILTQGGDLHKSIDVAISGSTLKVTSDLEYAEIHNDGGEFTAFGKYPTTMPQRQFIGESKKLNEAFGKSISTIINKTLK